MGEVLWPKGSCVSLGIAAIWNSPALEFYLPWGNSWLYIGNTGIAAKMQRTRAGMTP